MKVVVTDYEYKSIWQERQIITNAGFELLDYQCRAEQALIEATQDADAVIVQYAQMTRAVIEQLTHCKLIIKYGIGVNNIDVATAAKKGIAVCNVPDYGVDEVANHAIAMMMSLARKLPLLNESMRQGSWGFAPSVPLYRMAKSTLGVVGLGRIPQNVVKKMRPFNLRILSFDPYVDPKIAAKLGVELVGMEKMCTESDYILLHCPLTEDTTGLINKRTLSMMKPRTILVNTSRGPVINETDLIDALESGIIAAAGLDVYEQEPLDKQSKLLQMENVICTPHCAWYSEEAIDTLQRKVAQEVVNVLQGNPPWNAVKG